jgi:hypothetical protein
VLHDLPDIALALIVIGAFVLVWRNEGEDPLWQARWSALTPAERNRIAAAARSGKLLATDEDIELAAGYARRARRRRLPYAVAEVIRIPLGIALIAGGLLADSLIFILFGALFLFGGIWALIRGARLRHNLRETISRDHHV